MSESVSVRIKVCCIQSVDEARLAISNGADAIGLVSQMPSGSGFMINDQEIRSIVNATPPTFSTVLLTLEDDPSKIVQHQRATGANALQLLGTIGPEVIGELRDALPGIALTRVVSVLDSTSIDEALSFASVADALLLDSKVSHRSGGGTGMTHDWTISRRIVEESPLPVWLAGGLSPGNVAEAIQTVAPFGVDVCSGLRTNKVLDEALLTRFVKNAMVAAG